MPGATRLDIGDHAPTDGGPAKAVGHITWDRNASAAKPLPLVPYETLVSYFGRNPAGKKVPPHILWDPFVGRFTQFVPANSRSKSLADAPGGTRTNRAGSVVIQIEALFFPYCVVDGKTYARLVDTPCAGWPELLAWVRSWGVPDVWPMGRPTSFASNRSASTWAKSGGWYGHSQVPENDHQDPGSWPAFTTGIPPFPGRQYFVLGAHNDYALQLQQWLARGGWGPAYKVGPSRTMTQLDLDKVAALQRHYLSALGPADGLTGPKTWQYAYEVANGLRKK